MDVVVDWESIPWEEPEEGASQAGYRYKTCTRQGLTVQLIEVWQGFTMDEWCSEEHLFHVLEGETSIRFKDGTLRHLRQGETGMVPASEDNPHKMEPGTSERFVGLFFEQA